jgi:hypothetical protein
MKTKILSATDKREFNANVAITLDYADVAAQTSGAALSIISVLAGAKVTCVGTKLNTPFDVTGTGALAFTIGDGGSATALHASTVIALDGTEILYTAGGSPKVYLVDDTVDIFFTDATSMAYTVGSLTVYLQVENLNELPV